MFFTLGSGLEIWAATEAEIAEMAFKATQGKKITLGNLKKLDYDDVVAIYRMANKA